MDLLLARSLLDLYRAARESPIQEFQHRATALLRSVCRFDAAMSGTAVIDSERGLEFRSIHLYNIDEEFLSAHDGIAQEDRISLEVAKRAGSACAFNLRELMSTRKFPQVAALDKRFGLQNVLGFMQIEAETSVIHGCYLWRSAIGDQFSEREVRIGGALLPHVVEAGTVNRAVWLNEVTANSIARRGVRAVANARGILQTYDAPFFDLLAREWPDWSPPILPSALLHAISSSSHRRYSGAEITVACEPTHGMLFLLAREKARAFGLTPGQLSVARLIADGRTYKEVAILLNLSVATVRNHLHTAYGKLGVRNKTALARLLSGAAR